jgi:hypothetical protein
MRGDDRVRHCSACDKKVYDSKGMTGAELELLIAAHEGRRLPCVRLHRRFDGTINTRDCLTPRRRAAAWLRLKAAVAVVFLLAPFGAVREATAAGTAAKHKRPSKSKAPSKPAPPPSPPVKKTYDDYIDQGLGTLEL